MGLFIETILILGMISAAIQLVGLFILPDEVYEVPGAVEIGRY